VWDSDALAPVTVTWIVPADAKLQDRVELPEPVTLVGETVHEVLFVAKLTTPAKPFRADTVTVELPGEPALTVTLAVAAVTVKSWTA
jgi:hypothetical protein